MENQHWPALNERKPNHAYLAWAGLYMGLLSLVNILLAFGEQRGWPPPTSCAQRSFLAFHLAT